MKLATHKLRMPHFFSCILPSLSSHSTFLNLMRLVGELHGICLSFCSCSDVVCFLVEYISLFYNHFFTTRIATKVIMRSALSHKTNHTIAVLAFLWYFTNPLNPLLSLKYFFSLFITFYSKLHQILAHSIHSFALNAGVKTGIRLVTLDGNRVLVC